MGNEWKLRSLVQKGHHKYKRTPCFCQQANCFWHDFSYLLDFVNNKVGLGFDLTIFNPYLLQLLYSEM